MNRKLVMNIAVSVAALASVIAILLGILSMSIKLNGGGKVFDLLSNNPLETIKSHALGLVIMGVIGILMGIGSLIGIGIVTKKVGKDLESISNKTISILGVIALIGMILASVAMSFHSDLNDPIWVATHALQGIVH